VTGSARGDEPPGLADLARLDEDRSEVHGIGPGVTGGPLAQARHLADGLVEVPEPELGEVAPDLLGHEQHEGGDAFGRAREVGPQVGALGGDARLAGVAVAGPQHDAALGDHRRRAEAVLVGAEEGGDDDLAAGQEAAVDPHADPAAQVAVDQGCWVSARPSSHGMPACLIDESAAAPCRRWRR
jgi:hypothetical protein